MRNLKGKDSVKKQYGDFIRGKKEFQITEREIPRNWYNYLWNDRYITFVSQTGAGEGFLQDSLANRIPLVTGRGMYLIDSEEHWGITGLPTEEELDSFFCTHGRGYTYISTENRGIASETCFFVPNEENGEVWTVTLKNRSSETRALRLLAYCGTGVDGAHISQGYNLGQADFDKDLNGVIGKTYSFFDGKTREVNAFFAMNEQADGYDAAENAFVGSYGSTSYPKALMRGGCSDTAGLGEKLGFALQKDIMLKSGEETTLAFVCAVAFGRDEALEIKRRYENSAKVTAELQAVKDKFSAQTDGVSIETPDNKLNEMFPWLVHQANMGSRWARVRHNGYRDMMSDTECLAAVNPTLALERFKRVLSYQYSTGYAPRTVKDGAIRDNNFSDNTVWITFTAYAILKETGDLSILNIPVAFNDGSVASIYEHMRRSVDFLYHFRGLHNLIRIWGGDWNDCMNRAGLDGKGVSVWLSIAWYRANKMFEEIARQCGKTQDAAVAAERGKEMQQIIEKYGWDGEYYLCAYNDDGEKIGSQICEEGKVFLIPQLWAVFSGVSEQGRETAAMEAVEKYLSSSLGTLISAPPYTKFNPKIGTVTLKPAGVHENGGVYLHTLAWKIAADAILKRADKVEEDIEAILPFRNKVVDGGAEPYIMCNSYFGEQTGYRYGTPGQSWRTAAGQWLAKALIQYVFGLKPEMEGLRLDPCLPPSWKTAAITKNFRKATYHICYENHGVKVKSIVVNGEYTEGATLPYKDSGCYEVTVICE